MNKTIIPHSYHIYYHEPGQIPDTDMFGFTTPKQDKMSRKEFILDVLNMRRVINGSPELKELPNPRYWHIEKDR